MATSTAAADKQGPELVRELNAWHSTAIVVGTIIGSGIFLVPAEMMQAVGSARTALRAFWGRELRLPGLYPSARLLLSPSDML